MSESLLVLGNIVLQRILIPLRVNGYAVSFIRLSVFLSVEDGARVSEFHFCFGHQRALGAGAAVWVLWHQEIRNVARE